MLPVMNPASALLEINVTNATGAGRSFRARTAALEFGAGAIEFHADGSSYRRAFDEGLLTIFDQSGRTELRLHAGTAALTPPVLHILCESFDEQLAAPAYSSSDQQNRT